jgi:alkanesulfonate monooxygenase SsuD/methylene tetrahydromethanopterin reductase-like flavin-dependent oxidoreductase (luciferase family)
MSKGLRFGILHELEVRGRSQEIERAMFSYVIEQVRLAEELGFESSWFVEHHSRPVCRRSRNLRRPSRPR